MTNEQKPGQGEPVAWMYERNGKVRIGVERSEDMAAFWTETPLYTRTALPPSTNLSAVETKE